MDAKLPQNPTHRSRNAAVKGGLLSGCLNAISMVAHGNRKHFVVVLLVGFATNTFVGVMNPLAIKLIFDEGVIKRRFPVFVILSLGFLALFTCWRGGLFWYRRYVQGFKNKALRRITLEVLRKFYCLPYSKIIKQETGYFVSRIYDETSATVLPIIDCTTVLVNSAFSFAASFSLAALLSWRATLVLVIIVPAIYVLSSRFGTRLKRSTKSEKEQEARFRGVLARAISAYKVTRVFDLHERVNEGAASSFDEFLGAFNVRFRDSCLYAMLSGLCASFTESMVTVVAGYEILAGRMTFGGFMAFLSAFWMSTGAIRQALEQFGELPGMNAAVERMKEFEPVSKDLPRSGGNVLELKSAAFSYETGSDVVFCDLDLKVSMAERVLIVGPNGIGKSTLANVLAGFLDISSGVADTLPLDRISVVTFPMAFAPGTVLTNLSFGNGVVRRRIIDELIERFGIECLLDRDPSELSAGQQQRVYLVMALLKDADFYIFDEPLAHIDVDARPLILENILRYTEHKGLISIMHGDTQMHRHFDRVVFLAKKSPYEQIPADVAN